MEVLRAIDYHSYTDDCFPVELSGVVGFASRDPRRAMFPSLGQENFYRQRRKRKHVPPQVNIVFPVKAFKISASFDIEVK